MATGCHSTLKCIYLVQSRTFYAQIEKDFTLYFLRPNRQVAQVIRYTLKDIQ